MTQQIGPVLARAFREVCEDSNKRVKSVFAKISSEEMVAIEALLKKADQKNFNLDLELKKYLGVKD